MDRFIIDVKIQLTLLFGISGTFGHPNATNIIKIDYSWNN